MRIARLASMEAVSDYRQHDESWSLARLCHPSRGAEALTITAMAGNLLVLRCPDPLAAEAPVEPPIAETPDPAEYPHLRLVRPGDAE